MRVILYLVKAVDAQHELHVNNIKYALEGTSSLHFTNKGPA